MMSSESVASTAAQAAPSLPRDPNLPPLSASARSALKKAVEALALGSTFCRDLDDNIPTVRRNLPVTHRRRITDDHIKDEIKRDLFVIAVNSVKVYAGVLTIGRGWHWWNWEHWKYAKKLGLTKQQVFDEARKAPRVVQRLDMFTKIAASLENPSNVDTDALWSFLELCTTFDDVSDEMRKFLSKHNKGIEWVTILLQVSPDQIISSTRKQRGRFSFLLKKLLTEAANDLRHEKTQACKYIDCIVEVFDKDKPLHAKNEKSLDFRSLLASHFFKAKHGLQHFATYMAAHASTPRVPALGTVCCLVEIVAEVVMPSTGESTQTMEGLRRDAKSLWEALRIHLNPMSPTRIERSENVVAKICDAIVKIDPALRGSCFSVNVPTKPAAARVSLSPPRPPAPAEFGPAIAAARKSLESSRRLEGITARAVKQAEEMLEKEHSNFCLAHNLHASAQDAWSNLSMIQVQGTHSLFSKIAGSQILSASMVNDAKSLHGGAEMIRANSSKTRGYTAEAYNNALRSRAEAYKRVEDAKAEHGCAAKEVEAASSYLKEIERQFGVVDLDTDSPVQKRQRTN